MLRELQVLPGAYRTYQGWNEELRELFMGFCMGKKTLPVLYDTVFKKMMNPDTHPERLEDCTSEEALMLLKIMASVKDVRRQGKK